MNENSLFLHQKCENHESLKCKKKKKKKTRSQRPPRLYERPPGGGTAPVEKP